MYFRLSQALDLVRGLRPALSKGHDYPRSLLQLKIESYPSSEDLLDFYTLSEEGQCLNFRSRIFEMV